MGEPVQRDGQSAAREREAGELTTHLDTALRLVEREREILTEDRAAFRTFRKRVARLDVEHDGPTAAPQLPGRRDIVTGRASSESTFARAIRTAYTGTVMAVSHYESEYGESYEESLAAELGDAVAAVLFDHAAEPAVLKRQICSAAAEAIAERASMLEALAAERSSLRDAGEVIERVAEEHFAIRSRPFARCRPTELRRLHADLDGLRADCESLADRRQREIRSHHRSFVGFASVPHLAEYLYQSAEVTYPVLATVTELLDDIADSRRWVAAAMGES